MKQRTSSLIALSEALAIFILAILVFNLARDIPVGWAFPGVGFPLPYLAVLIVILTYWVMRGRSLRFFGKSPCDKEAEVRLFIIAVIPTLIIKGALQVVDWQGMVGAWAVSFIILIATWVVACVSDNADGGQTSLLALGIVLFMHLPARTVSPSSDWTLLIYRCVYTGLVAFTEELIFRGVIFSQLENPSNKTWTLFTLRLTVPFVTSSLLFGLWHVINGILVGVDVVQSLAWGLWTFFFGLYLGLVRMKSNRIVLPALLHWIVNV